MDNSAIDEPLSRSELRDVDYALEVCFAAGKCGADGTPEARTFEALHAKVQGMIRRMT